jgi:hypothetical protein
MSNHARLSPSDHKWPHCPGSIRENSQYPDVSGRAAIAGTGSHLLLEISINDALTTGVWSASALLNHTIGEEHEDKPQGWLVDQPMINRVNICLDYIKGRVALLHTTYPNNTAIRVEAESVSNPGAFYDRDDWWGTCDITIMVTADEKCVFVEVIDYKDGITYVKADNNTQLIAYAAGKAAWLDPDTPLMMTIVQPKTNDPIRYQMITAGELKQKTEALILAATLTDDPDAPLIAGDHCQMWCSHQPHCNVYLLTQNEQIIDEAVIALIAKINTDIEQLTNDELSHILDAEDSYKIAFDKAKTEVEHRIGELQQLIPGWVIAPGRSRQEWSITEEELVKRLRGMKMPKADMYPTKFISPNQALKYNKFTDRQVENLREIIVKTPGEAILKRGHIQESAEQMFADAPIVSEQPATNESIIDEDSFVNITIDPATSAHSVNNTTPAPKTVNVPTPAIEQMTAKAKGVGIDQYLQAGWSKQQLIEEGYLTLVPAETAQQPAAEIVESFI